MITEEQLNHLYKFCRKHYVQYYDVQAELVDHLSSAIEDRMAANKSLGFEQALDQVYASFGIKGFADIVEANIKLVKKKSRSERKVLFLSYFTIPKLAFTVFIYLLLLTIGYSVPPYYKQHVLLCAALIVIFFEISSMIRTYRMFRSQKQQLLATTERWSVLAYSGFFLQVYFQSGFFGLFNSKLIISDLNYALVSLLILLLFIATLAHRNFIGKLFVFAKNKYPLAFESH